MCKKKLQAAAYNGASVRYFNLEISENYLRYWNLLFNSYMKYCEQNKIFQKFLKYVSFFTLVILSLMLIRLGK